MSRAAVIAGSRSRIFDIGLQSALIVGATLMVAFCARLSVPLPGIPVPLSFVNFAVILVGLTLGSRRGFAALALYLAEGAIGLPVFSPVGAPGILRFMGPTAGYLLAYPFVAALAGYLYERGRATFARAAIAAIAAEVLLFACGLAWLLALTHSLQKAFIFGLYWFVFGEVIKIMLAAAAASTWRGRHVRI